MNFTTYTAFSLWNLSIFPGVTTTHSCDHIFEWDKILIEHTYLLVGIIPMIISLNLLNRFPLSGLDKKSTVIPIVEHHYTVTSFLFL